MEITTQEKPAVGTMPPGGADHVAASTTSTPRRDKRRTKGDPHPKLFSLSEAREMMGVSTATMAAELMRVCPGPQTVRYNRVYEWENSVRPAPGWVYIGTARLLAEIWDSALNVARTRKDGELPHQVYARYANILSPGFGDLVLAVHALAADINLLPEPSLALAGRLKALKKALDEVRNGLEATYQVELPKLPLH